MFVSHAAVQKVILHVVGCDWCMVFDPYFFAAEKPLPMMRTCTIVNFHNLHSLLGQFGSFILNKQNQVTTSCVVLVSGKKLYYVVFFFLRDTKGKVILVEERARLLLHIRS